MVKSFLISSVIISYLFSTSVSDILSTFPFLFAIIQSESFGGVLLRFEGVDQMAFSDSFQNWK